jgi:hypothetical protein
MDATTGVTVNQSAYVNTNLGVGGITTLNGFLSGTSATFSSAVSVQANLSVTNSATPTFNLINTSGTGSGAQCIMNLATYTPGANASSCSIVTTDDGSFGNTFAIKQKTKGAATNSQFTSLLLDDTGNCTIAGGLTVGGATALTASNYGTYISNTGLSTSGGTITGNLAVNGTTTLGSNLIYNYAAVPSTANSLGYTIQGSFTNPGGTISTSEMTWFNLSALPMGVYIMTGSMTVSYLTSAAQLAVIIRNPSNSIITNGTAYGTTSSAGYTTVSITAYVSNTAVGLYKLDATSPSGSVTYVSGWFTAMRIA